MASPNVTARNPRVVIIGAGFGGLSAAKRLAKGPCQITLIDRHNYHLFQPLLYQVATAALSPADIASPIRGIFRRYQNVKVILANVSGIDVERREVIAEGHHVPFDMLVIATGAQHAYFGHDGQCHELAMLCRRAKVPRLPPDRAKVETGGNCAGRSA